MSSEIITLNVPADQDFCDAAMRYLSNPTDPVEVVTRPAMGAVTALRYLAHTHHMTPVEINVVSATMSDTAGRAALRIDSVAEPVVLIVVDNGEDLPGAQEVRDRVADLTTHKNIRQVFQVHAA